MHEIVTLQFGQQSNYLGTHFWNTQESYFTYPGEPESPINHDVLFKPGVAPDGSDTFTPRALIYDLKGAFGSMRRVNALYEAEDDDPESSHAWISKPVVTKAKPIPQSPYQIALDAGLAPPKLDTESVRYWSDYSRVYYHPKSLVQLSEFEVNDSLMPFENWDVGMELFEKMEREVDLVDRDLRPFVEECDGIQGFQIMTGIDDAWGGWASGWLERLRDEFGKVSIWTWGVGEQGGNPKVPMQKKLQQIVNSAKSLNAFAELSSVYIPTSNSPIKAPSYLNLDRTSPWHVGALQAMALDTVTMSSRLRDSDGLGRGSLRDLEDTINNSGKRRIAKLGMSIADPDVLAKIASSSKEPVQKAPRLSRQDSEETEDHLADFDLDVFTQDYRIASRVRSKKEHIFGRVETTRGEWNVVQSGEINPNDRFSNGPVVQRYTAPLLFPLLDSFPSIVDLGGDGQAEKLAVYSGLTTSTAVADQVRKIATVVGRIVSVEEREALANGLQTLAEEYDEGWDGGSDSDGDD